MKRIFQIITLVLMIMLLSPGGQAQAEQETLQYAFSEFTPWKITLDDGSLGGIDVEIVKIMAERMNLKLEIQKFPLKRVFAMLEDGDSDIATSILRRPSRELFLYYIEPPYLTESNKAFYVLKGNEHLVQKYDDLAKLKVGTHAGSKFFPQFDQDISINKIVAANLEKNIQMLLAERINTFIYTEIGANYQLTKRGLNDRIVAAPYRYTKQQNVHMVLSKKSKFAHRRDEFNRVMADMVREGVVERIKAKYIK